MKLTKSLIKSYIPEDYIDGTKLNGISLEHKSYSMFCIVMYKKYMIRTSLDNEVIDILRNTFNVKYIEIYWGHYHEYHITLK